MKKIFALFIITCLFFDAEAQSILGAWEAYTTTKTGDKHRTVFIFTEGYQVVSIYNTTTGKFISTEGGSWKLQADTLTQTVEFDTENSERVGTEERSQIIATEKTLEITNSNLKLTKIDDGTPGELQGAWLMSGRKRDGKIQSRDTNRPRKTMKILSGTRFQWIAYNTETKQFMATGGGTYTTINGEYTEHIEFFSKDDSRVGASLDFNYERMDDEWHHSGLSSKGDPIYEIWQIRK